MSFDILLAWTIFSGISLVLPGPDFVYITSVSLYKRSFGIFAGLGVQVGITFHFLLTYIGAVTFFSRYPLVFTSVQMFGGLFLLYLAYSILTSAWRELSYLRQLKNQGEQADAIFAQLSKKEQISNLDCFKKGFLVNILNIKAFLFIVGVVPQFIDARASFSIGEQFLVLTAIDVVLGIVWWTILALMVNYFSQKFATPSFRAKIEIFAGIIILCLALGLLARIIYTLIFS
ncbi:hypothetical protein CJP74_07305 [Psittacicella melopsittaci]|uniref:Threonine/homoserine/homoserine lactone efflux protein n=1 Tax=Psittacicella melopsittaci TaxID=2028576 RepID=A0A3A1XZJ0_9GAMM|nr:LysE family translocator [Psittacicella melopsittaci]RIY31442.1 hypothetical protein CJP74_07305 [Psittacicella melopsittaci]